MTAYNQARRGPNLGLLLVALTGTIAILAVALVLPQLGVVGGGSGATSVQNSVEVVEDINILMSTNHAESGRVITVLAGSTLAFTGPGGRFEEGSLEIWGGLHPYEVGRGSIALLLAKNGNVWYGAVSGNISSVASATSIEVAPGAFLDGAGLKWDAAWVLSQKGGMNRGRLVDDPSKYLDLGQGWSRWTQVQQKWGLYTRIAALPFPLPQPPPGAKP